ncbi:MAG: hypothetical protein ACRD3V_13465, partial [Vicinamibacteria bacterium]
DEAPGRYRIELRLMCEEDGERPSIRAVADWRQEDTAWIEASGLPSGLYDAIVDGLSSVSDSGWGAWVLVASADQHAALRARFEEAREIVTAWGEKAPYGEKEGFLRAYLTHLARPGCESDT